MRSRTQTFFLIVLFFATVPALARNTEMVDGHVAMSDQVILKLGATSAAFLNQLRSLGDADDFRQLGANLNLFLLHSRSANIPRLTALLRALPGVIYVEPDYVVRGSALPNDPNFSQQWSFLNTATPGVDIGATSAWDISTGSTANVVGVIDTGVDYNHPDLAANIWTAPVSFTLNLSWGSITCPAGSHGYNAIARSCDPLDDHGHGSHVSGTIGAIGNNAVGVTGVNWTTRIMGLKFLDASGSGSTSDAIDAIEFAIQAKARFAGTATPVNVRVLSNSWGGSGASSALLDEINKANTNDMLFVVAAGNDGVNIDISPTYPAAFTAPNIISVAATTNTDALAGFSNWSSTHVHLGAPGTNILSTLLGNAYGYLSGTSMATPHVSGAAMLVLSKCSLSTAGLKSVILSNVDADASLASLTVTGGRLKVNRAIRACSGTIGPSTPITPVATATGKCPMSFYTSNCTATSNGVDMTGASLIVVVENNYINDPTLNTVTDSGGNTWHHLTPQRDVNWAGSSVVIWYAYDKAGAPLVTGSNQTVTIAGGFNQSFVVSAWRGSLTGADPFDSENGFKPSSLADSTTTVQAGSITPSQSNELIIAGVGALQSTDGIMTINSGFTSLGSVPAVTSMFVQAAYLLQGGPAAVNLTWTGSTNYFHSAVIAGFKAAPGGASVVTPTFSPGAGSYSSAQSVTIATTTSGASIRYTTDGSTPSSTTGTLYTSPVPVSSSLTLKALAYKSGMTDSVVASAAYSITSSVAITVTSSPSGLALSVDGSACTAPCSQTWSPGSNHSIAVTTTPQAGGVGTQYAYASWSDSGAQSHTITVPSTPTTYMATFTTQYFLTTSAGTGGTISPASSWYNSGATASVSATANPGFVFSGFSGALTGTVTPQTLTMNAPKSVTAAFTSLGGGSITPVATATGKCPMSFYTSNCTATSNGVDMTGASLIVVVENNYINDPTLNTVTDSGGNTWHHLTPQRDINWAGSSVVIWYAYDKAGAPLVTGSNQTVTIAGGFNQSFVVSAWRGSLTGADPFDSENGFKPSSFADSTTTVQAGSITPSQSNELIIAGVGALQSTDGIMTINSGFTSLGSVPAVTSMFVQTAYLLQGGPAAVNLTWTGSTNYFHSAVIAAFKAGS